MRRIALALGLTLILPACGLSAAGVADGQGPAASVPTAASDTAPSTITSPAPSTPAAAPQPTTTVATSPRTVPPPAPAEPAAMEVAAYFLIDESGHNKRSGPFLAPVAREISSTRAVARAAIEQLLAGPTQGEREGVPALSSAIPEGVELLGLTIDSGTARIDLSSEFGLGDDSAAVAMRVAQVVFTLTRFETVERVRFLQEGTEAGTPTSSGNLINGAVSRADYLDFAAAISVETPLYGGEAADPLRVTGFAAVFEAVFKYALTDGDGLIVEEGLVSTSNGTGWGSFDFTIDYGVDREQVGSLVVWAHSAQDGARIDVREYPIRLVP